jgi:23S rRNA pseudouridine2605 synthase
MTENNAIRLQKYLAMCGIASRRKAEDLIASGVITVNDKVVREMGTKIDPSEDSVKYQGKIVKPEESVVIILNKPMNVLSTVSDPTDRITVMDLIPEMKERLFPVGRLDWSSEGLLILTNDGEMAHALMHPSKDVPRTYEVKIKGHLNEEELDILRTGIKLDDGPCRPALVSIIQDRQVNERLKITIYEGRNRIVRRMMEKLGHDVIRLERTQFGPISLGNLEKGKFKYLNKIEIERLRKSIGLQ